jgi:hypothetical protein
MRLRYIERLERLGNVTHSTRYVGGICDTTPDQTKKDAGPKMETESILTRSDAAGS